MKYYISDLHFGHANVIRFDNRPFNSIAEMETEIIRRWNERVKPEDEVYILGDFCWGFKNEWIRILDQLKGHKFLILGNHDLKSMPTELKRRFDGIDRLKEIVDGKRHIIMCHYPILFYRCAYNPEFYMFCGHVHTTKENDFLNKWRQELKNSRTRPFDSYAQVYNCFCGFFDYTPQTADEIIQYWERYDEVVK